MKRRRFRKSKNQPRQDSAKARPGMLGRLMADVRKKEYAVYVEPILKPFSRNTGSVSVVQAVRELDALPPAPPQVSNPEPAPKPVAPPVSPIYQPQIEEDVVDPRFVEEIFARSAPPPIRPENEHELAEWDAGEAVPVAVAPTEPE